MKLQFYPYDYQYKVKEDKVYVYLYSKLDDGQKSCIRIKCRPYFYAKIQKIPNVDERLNGIRIQVGSQEGKITGWEKVEKELLGHPEQLLKIYTNIPKAVPPISQELESWGVTCYEKDIFFVQRFVRDTGILPLHLAEAEGEFLADNLELRVPLFEAKTIIPLPSVSSTLTIEKQPQLRILSIDIETYSPTKIIHSQKNPILMIAFSGVDELGNAMQKVITWKKFPHQLEYVEVVSDEKELLQRFKEIIIDYHPDIITGYFTDGFDFPYLKTRADQWKITLDLGLDYSQLEAGDQRKDCKINGILHLDVFKFVRNIFGKNLKTDSFSLDEVAHELLGHRKHPVDVSKLYLAWDNNDPSLEEYCKYNFHDADLTLKLCQKLLFEMIEFSQICGLPLFDVIRMTFSRLVESYIQKKAIEFNVLSPNRPSNFQINQRMDESYEGAFVYEPRPGLYDNIVVFDFRSLYPSIITSHNIGPESLQCSCCKEKKSSHVPGLEEYWFCEKRKFIPQLLGELITKRSGLKKEIKELKKAKQETYFLEAKSYALKILANSFYGYLGYFGARWYCFECARSTTAYARDYIQETIKKAELAGFSVVYGDTDSMFVQLGEKTLQEAQEFLQTVNKSLPGQMELDYEGFYSRGIFVALKGGDRESEGEKKSIGAKKKYALLREDGSLKITGFETVRRNWSEISKEVQENVLRLVLEKKNEEAVKYVRNIASDLKSGKTDKKKLIIKTKITRDLGSYSSIGPHVKVAQEMVERGNPISPGTIVEYIIVKGDNLVRDRAKIVEDVKEGEYDAEYYLNNQIIPAVSPIFAVIGYTEEDIFSSTKQKGLGDFFR